MYVTIRVRIVKVMLEPTHAIVRNACTHVLTVATLTNPPEQDSLFRHASIRRIRQRPAESDAVVVGEDDLPSFSGRAERQAGEKRISTCAASRPNKQMRSRSTAAHYVVYTHN